MIKFSSSLDSCNIPASVLEELKDCIRCSSCAWNAFVLWVSLLQCALLCSNSPSPSVIKCEKKELVIGPSRNKPFKLAKAFPRALIWVCCRFLIISVNLLHCPEPPCRCRLLSQAADTLQALCFPCVSPDSAWHQTWEASSGSMKGKKVETWPPRADKAAFSCVISPQPEDKSLRVLPLNFSCSEFQPPPTLTKAARLSERTSLLFS